MFVELYFSSFLLLVSRKGKGGEGKERRGRNHPARAGWFLFFSFLYVFESQSEREFVKSWQGCALALTPI